MVLTSASEKPAYRIPLMREILDTPLNGYSMVSTFTGAGGSCLGFRMEGFKTLWASEFVDHAAETYSRNFPDVQIDTNDIRTVTVEHVLRATGLKRGELDVLEGSPPCSGFSMSGKRDKGWGEEHIYSDTTQRVDDLFFEYARLLEGLQPKVFVAENVPGLVRGRAKGYFLYILRALRETGYRVEAHLLDSQWLGVPQNRERLIFMGVRNDLGVEPRFPTPLKYRYTVFDALKDLPEHKVPEEAIFELHRPAYLAQYRKMRIGEGSKKFFNLVRVDPNKPCPTIHAASTRAAAPCHWNEARFFTIPELKRICGFPDDFIIKGRFDKQGERLGRAVPPPMARAVAKSVKEVLDAVASPRYGSG